MTNLIRSESITIIRDTDRPLRKKRGNHVTGIARLLDTLPWWAVVVIAILTYLLLHQLATADLDYAHRAGTMETIASQVIIQILAGAGQYVFPVILLGEAVGAAIAAWRLESRKSREAWNTTWTVTSAARNMMGTDGVGEGMASPRDRDKIPEAQRVWSLALLNSVESRRFAELSTKYYQEKGIYCESTQLGAGAGTGLKLFQDDSGKATAIVQCRAWGTPWVGAKQIGALRGAMDSEQIVKGFFMTPGAFSKDAKESARVNGITLIDARLFLMMIRRLPPAAQERLLHFATQSD